MLGPRSRNSGSIALSLMFVFIAVVTLAAALAIVAPSPVAATEWTDYPWCLGREGYLSCSYSTRQQCEAAARAIGGCALNPRLLFGRARLQPHYRTIGPGW
jgi:hypothetical protein